MKKILLFGDTGKMGTAIKLRIGNSYELAGFNSTNINIENFDEVEHYIGEHQPDIVINTIAMLGLDNCENNPQQALTINTLLPRFLAEKSNPYNFLLVHFSTDSVFNNEKQTAYTESDAPTPLNLYGATKYSADCLIQALAKRYYVLRIAMMFGPSNKRNQFVEKMLDKMMQGETVRVADDVITSPCFNLDIADQLLGLIDSNDQSYGVYHTANNGAVSLYELMSKFAKILNLQDYLEKGSHNDFNCYALKNTNTAIESNKLTPLRSWQSAVEDYCKEYLDSCPKPTTQHISASPS